MSIMNQISVTVVVLTKNESINIQRCIESLEDYSRVVVLDSGSNDDTKFIVENSRADFYENIQIGKFMISEQRNWALLNCHINTRWVLFLDADERVTPELNRDIRSAILDESLDAYLLTPKYIFWNKWLKRSFGYPKWHSRLLKADVMRFSGGVWEHFVGSSRIGKLKTPYLHYANSKGFSDWIERHNRYSSWEAEKAYNFLTTKEDSCFETQLSKRKRVWAARFWYLRPILRFLNGYVYKGGILEGIPGLVFNISYAIYEFMIVVKIVEFKFKSRGLTL